MALLRTQLRPALAALALLTLLTGLAYPLLVTGLAQALFPFQAGGSILRDAQGRPLGSALIGQPFDRPEYFWGRLSATGPAPYTAFSAQTGSGSSGSNYGPLSPALEQQARARIAALRAADPDNTRPVPVDLITASASGLDPQISPAAAEYQVARVARARGLEQAQVRALVARFSQGRQLGLLGEPRVNVLLLNLALDGRLP